MTSENSNERQVEVLTSFKPSVAEPSGAPRGDSPLIEFRGKGAGYLVTRGKSQGSGREWTRIEFRFMDIEVIDATEVYPNPTASLSMFYSDPGNTPRRRAGEGTDEWGWWSESTRSIYGDADDVLDDMFGGIVGAGEGKMPDKEGRVQHWKRIPGSFRTGPRNGKFNNEWEEGMPEDWKTKWHDEIVMGWKVLEVEGVGKLAETGAVEGQQYGNGGSGNPPTAVGAPSSGGGNDLLSYVLDMAEGKKSSAFYEVALDDPQVMKNPGLIQQLNQREFIQNMKDLQRLTEDSEGVLHKVS